MYPHFGSEHCTIINAYSRCPAVAFNQEVKMKVCGSGSCLLSEDQREISNKDKYGMCSPVTFIIAAGRTPMESPKLNCNMLFVGIKFVFLFGLK